MSAPDTYVYLGDFTFSRFEIPEQINFGGEQVLVVHQLPGGARVVDAMGRSDAPLQWSGLFLGANAMDRARYVDSLRVAGKALTLQWAEFNYSVVIRSFSCNFERYYKLPYSITCEVVQDLTRPITVIADSGIDAALRDDNNTASSIGSVIADAQITSSLSTLDSAIKAVSDFAKAAQTQINTVLTPIAAINARINILLGSVGGVITNVTTLGGILPNNPIAQQAAGILNQVTAMTQLPQLYNLQAVLGRMGANLGSLGSSGQNVTLAGGNLYQLAAQNYSDAASWTTIAKANKLSDPQITGIQTLKIPPVSDGQNGVLNV